MLEIEQKFRVEDHTAVREQIGQRFEVRFVSIAYQTDVYFAHPSRDFGQTDEAFRMRSVSTGPGQPCSATLVTYKGPRLAISGQGRNFKMRREIEVGIAGGAEGSSEFREMLVCLGFLPELPVQKLRETHSIVFPSGLAEISLDDVEGLGKFVEIEIIAEPSDSTDAQSTIADISGQLGLHSPIIRSYRNLLRGD